MPFVDESCWYEIYESPRESAPKRGAIFLDRDGVIIEEKHYLHDPEHVEVYPGVADILERFRLVGVPVVVVTNQSGIGRGLFGWTEFNAVHQRMLDLLRLDAPFAAVYASAHHPSASQASWRKPNPGMFLRAAADLNLDLEPSVMIGDKLVDLQAAERAGIHRLVHVRTGHGDAERAKVLAHCPQAELLDSLADFKLDILPTQ